ncbi:MAG: VCBS repeat-containing protein, partial [Chitinophagaceae bacterium]
MLFLEKNILFIILSSWFISSCHRTDTLFTSVSSSTTNISFRNEPLKRKAFGILYYLYYYNGGGVSTGDINNDGLADIYFTANSPGKNKLYLNKGNFKFEDITETSQVKGSADWCTGSTMADVNGDGYLDIYVSAVSHDHGLKGRNELFINNKNNTFTESAPVYGLDFSGYSTQSVFFDYDHDGDLDCYILNQSHKANENIVDTINRRKFDAYAGDRLYRNEMNTASKKFIDVSAQAGIYQSSLDYGLGMAVADFNNDGWEDIYIGNDFHENDYYYVNKGDGTFAESAGKHFNHFSRFSMGNDAADYNNDGQMDIITVDMLPQDEKILKSYGSDEQFDTYKQKIINNGYLPQSSKNCLQTNNGNGISFSDVSLISGVSATDWSWSPLFADFDNDGNKDLFISNGIVKRPVDLDYIKFVSDLYVHKALNQTDKYDNMALEKMPDGASHPFLYKGDGQLNFDDVSDSWGSGDMKGYFNGASYADLDNDGNLDLVINCIDAPAVILKNNAKKKNFISISFKGTGMNSFGIGAKAYLFNRQKMQYQQLMLTRGFQSSAEPRLHFGLGDIKKIDSLLVVWPNQKYQLIRNVEAGKQILVKQEEAMAGFKHELFFPVKDSLLKDITHEIDISWKHTENRFIDFNTQYLIPHMQSTRGPKIAVADINNDGLDDFFVCGAKGNAGCLMAQNKEGRFLLSDTSLFKSSMSSEDVDAIFFDANQDGYPDLYVVSGGNEYEDGNPHLADHLYLNDTKGHFTLATGSLPSILSNKTSVAFADIDKDGDNDIFIGGFANAKAYGYPQSSYLQLNDGKGNFTLAPTAVITLKETGMVTCSAFTDLNQDGWPDLVIAGEWMPVKLYMNNKGVFHEISIPQSTGLWQTLYCTDVN